MTKNIISIGLPSKGRLKDDTINIFKKNKLNIYSERGERDLFGYIKKIPNELWDAARMDGASHFYFLRKVVIPMSMPIIVTVSLFAFILAWNSFAWPLLILTKEDWFPVTVSIYSFIREAGTQYNLLMAASLISIFPVLLLYFFTQRLFLESISNFGLKQ